MDAETAALFPDRVVEAQRGDLPRGWQSVRLGDIAEVVMGQSPPGDTYNEDGDGLPFYQGVRDFGFRFPSRRVYCTAPTRLAEKGDVLLSVRAPVGSLNVAAEQCAVGRGVAALRLKANHAGFLLYLLKATQSGWAKFEAGGTVFGAATKADVHGFEVVIPPLSLIDRFSHLVEPMDAQIEVNEAEAQTLTAIRDALLPKLLSGELRVTETERLVEAAT
jgi:type I restriction enzyme S subunit